MPKLFTFLSFLIFIFLLPPPSLVSAQTNFTSPTDSLKTLLLSAKDDTNKVYILNALSEQLWRTGNYDDALIYAENAKYIEIQLSRSSRYLIRFAKHHLTITYNIMGSILFSQGNYPKALKNFFASLKISQEIGEKNRIAGSFNNIGNIYLIQDNYPEALKNYFSAQKIKEEIGQTKDLHYASILNNIGLIYGEQSNYPEALKNYFAALSIESERGDKYGIANSYNNIGLI